MANINSIMKEHKCILNIKKLREIVINKLHNYFEISDDIIDKVILIMCDKEYISINDDNVEKLIY